MATTPSQLKGEVGKLGQGGAPPVMGELGGRRVERRSGGRTRPEGTPRAKRLSKAWLAMPAVLVVGVFALWQGRSLLAGPGEQETVLYFTVKPMSFQVVLHEKGELKAASSVDIKCEVDGRSTIISLIDEGMTVKEGDLLVELASDEIAERIQKSEISVASSEAAAAAAENEYSIQLDENESNINKAKLTLELARKKLKKYIEGDYVQSKTTAELDIKEAESNLLRAKDTKESSDRLYEQKFIARKEMEDARFGLQKAEFTLQKSKLALKILEYFDHDMQMKILNADVDEAERELARVEAGAEAKEAKSEAAMKARKAERDLQVKQLAKYQDQKAKTKIIAPAPGLVVYARGRHWDSSDMIKEGAQVRERQTLISLPDTSVMVVEVRVHEAKSNQIALGQTAIVKIEGVLNKRFTGKVTKIATLADSRDRWLNRDLKEYVTEITLDEADENLKPAATAEAEILVTELKDVLTVPVQSVYNKGGRRFVFVRTGRGDRAEPVEVKIGQSSDEFAEIKAGLVGGEEVMMVFTDEMKQKLPEIEPEAQAGMMPAGPVPSESRQPGASRSGKAAKPSRGPGNRSESRQPKAGRSEKAAKRSRGPGKM